MRAGKAVVLAVLLAVAAAVALGGTSAVAFAILGGCDGPGVAAGPPPAGEAGASVAGGLVAGLYRDRG